MFFNFVTSEEVKNTPKIIKDTANIFRLDKVSPRNISASITVMIEYAPPIGETSDIDPISNPFMKK